MSDSIRLHILNDLHLEATRWGDCPGEGGPPEADLVLLGGDVWHGTLGVEWAAERWPDTPVVYVFGNHEMQGERPEQLLRRAAGVAPGHVHVLDGESVDIQGFRVAGATLWTDFGVAGEEHRGPSMGLAARDRPEYRWPPDPDGWRLTPEETAARFQDAAARLSSIGATARLEGVPLIVVTHHPPLAGDLGLGDPRGGYSATRPLAGCGWVPGLDHGALASDRRDLVELVGAATWVFGHTHRCVDRCVGATRFVSNSRGLTSIGGVERTAFNPNLVLAVPAIPCPAPIDGSPGTGC